MHMDKVVKFDFSNFEHKSLLFVAFNFNKKWLRDDSLHTPDEFYESLKNNVLNGKDELFIYYVCNEPYGYVYLDFDRFNNITIHASTISNGNIFKSARILKNVVDYCFKKKQANKVKIGTLVYQHLAEIIAKYVGFKKEGLLKDEITINGKSVSRLILAITKKDYKNLVQRSKKELLEIIKKVTQNVKER